MSVSEKRTPLWRGRLVLLLPAAVFGGLAVAFYWGLWNKDDRLPSALIGRPIPEFNLPPIVGRQIGLSSADLQGQVSIVNVWASWCVPCRVEMPLLVELAEDSSVPIYGINYKDDADEALAFLAELGDPYARIGAVELPRFGGQLWAYRLKPLFGGAFVVDG